MAPLLRALLRALLLPLPGECGPGPCRVRAGSVPPPHVAAPSRHRRPRGSALCSPRDGAGGQRGGGPGSPAGRGRERAAGYRPLGAVNRPLGAVNRPGAPEGWAL